MPRDEGGLSGAGLVWREDRGEFERNGRPIEHIWSMQSSTPAIPTARSATCTANASALLSIQVGIQTFLKPSNLPALALLPSPMSFSHIVSPVPCLPRRAPSQSSLPQAPQFQSHSALEQWTLDLNCDGMHTLQPQQNSGFDTHSTGFHHFYSAPNHFQPHPHTEIPIAIPDPSIHHSPQLAHAPLSNNSVADAPGVSGSLDPSTGLFSRTAEHSRIRTAQACEKCRSRKAKVCPSLTPLAHSLVADTDLLSALASTPSVDAASAVASSASTLQSGGCAGRTNPKCLVRFPPRTSVPLAVAPRNHKMLNNPRESAR